MCGRSYPGKRYLKVGAPTHSGACAPPASGIIPELRRLAPRAPCRDFARANAHDRLPHPTTLRPSTSRCARKVNQSGKEPMDYLLSLLTDPTAWVALLMLIAMEVVLGIDNLIFISILTNKLPEQDRRGPAAWASVLP
jgi:hypothetical protein